MSCAGGGTGQPSTGGHGGGRAVGATHPLRLAQLAVAHDQPRELGEDGVVAVLQLLGLAPGRGGDGEAVALLGRVVGVQAARHAVRPQRVGVGAVDGFGLVGGSRRGGVLLLPAGRRGPGRQVERRRHPRAVSGWRRRRRAGRVVGEAPGEGDGQARPLGLLPGPQAHGEGAAADPGVEPRRRHLEVVWPAASGSQCLPGRWQRSMSVSCVVDGDLRAGKYRGHAPSRLRLARARGSTGTARCGRRSSDSMLTKPSPVPGWRRTG